MPTLAEQHPHLADGYVLLDEATHTYNIHLPEDSSDASLSEIVSVTRLLGKYFKPFDSVRIANLVSMSCYNKQGHLYEGMTSIDIRKKWEIDGEEARHSSHMLHRAIELYFNPGMECATEEVADMNKVTESVEFQQFQDFWQDLQASRKLENDTIVPYRTEWIIYDRSARVAGTVDMLFKNIADDSYTLVDWKRCKRLVRTSKDKGMGLMDAYPDCNLIKYTFQLNVYRYILENVYGLRIRNAFLAVMHPTAASYHIEAIPKEPITSDIIIRMFTSLRATHVLRWRIAQDQKNNSPTGQKDEDSVRVRRDSED